jgi:hypothetical protein
MLTHGWCFGSILHNEHRPEYPLVFVRKILKKS